MTDHLLIAGEVADLIDTAGWKSRSVKEMAAEEWRTDQADMEFLRMRRRGTGSAPAETVHLLTRVATAWWALTTAAQPPAIMTGG